MFTMTTNSSIINPAGHKDGVVLQGYHKKLKTMKKKYFVLYADNGVNSARLEYYDNEKKFKSRSNPKRTIILRNCFNIHRRLDTKHKFVIALSTKDDGFCIVLDSEQELNTWLRALLALQRGEDTESDPPKPTFEHVWQVQVQRKGLAEEKGIIGSYHVCLTTKSLTLVRIGSPTTGLGENRLGSVEFYLTTIRRCGDSQCFFYMEVGRHSAIGAGELWMETEDTLIAQNMHTIIYNAMSSSVKTKDENFSGQMRKRSASANEASKPISMLQRRQTHSSNKPMNSSPLSGTTLGRERCDSLPSRNRTASECSNQSLHNTSMPPPRTIPAISNRPHSMYNNRHSHSPPMNTLSPSTGCSGSDGSLSTDETDSFGHSLTPDESGNFVMRYYNTCASDAVIPEENTDDFWYSDNKCNSNENNGSQLDKMNNPNSSLSLPISANQNISRKGSPAAHLGSIEGQGQYMDMYSPCGSSPCDQTGSGYMPISPGVEFPRGLYPGSSGGHSRASSLAEETVDGYVPMAPLQSQDYVDMEQSLKQHQMSSMSSAASSCSITSGTPSTDLRFAEYPLDKVKSRFTPDDEDVNSPNNRPLRAYSVGSRLEHNKRKLRVDTLNTDQNNARVRAFSVGSKAKVPRSDLFRGIFASSLMSCHVTNNNNNNNNSDTTTNAGKGKKSSSAPILVHKSHSSVDRMSDLMEIDFSKNTEQSDSSHTKSSPIRISSFPVSVPVTRSKYDSQYYNNSSPRTGAVPGYVDMKPGSLSDKFSPTSTQKSIDSGYLEMRPVGLSKSPSLSSSPSKSISSQNSAKPLATSSLNVIHKEDDYIDMSLNNTNSRRIPSDDYLNVSPIDRHYEERMMEVDDVQTPTRNTSEGYMEMSWHKAKRNMANRDYSSKISNLHIATNVNIGSNGETRHASSPIDIVCMLKNKNVSNLVSNSETFTESCRNDSRESGAITPSTSHGIIFPFSPGSPNKSFNCNDFAQRKCLVDATSGTVTLQNEITSIDEPDSTKLDNKYTPKTGVTNSKNKILNNENAQTQQTYEKVEALSNDYADMSLGAKGRNEVHNKSIEYPDYVNYEPNEKTMLTIIKDTNKQEADSNLPMVHTTKAAVTSLSSIETPIVTPILNKKSLLITLNSSTTNEKTNNILHSFKPIASSTDEIFMKTKNANNSRKVSSPKSTISSYLGTATDKAKNEDNSGYELLQMRSDSSLQTKRILSRPNSVNSEKISPAKNIGRPNSANSELLPSISTSSSTSTLCGGSSSSSSTLCGSKSQSPLSTSRPQSFSDTIVASRPESVSSIADQSISSRPPSVSSERELHYASLVLPPSSNNHELSTKNINNGINSHAKVNSSTSGESSSPSPNANGGQQQATFTYAQIDFNKS